MWLAQSYESLLGLLGVELKLAVLNIFLGNLFVFNYLTQSKLSHIIIMSVLHPPYYLYSITYTYTYYHIIGYTIKWDINLQVYFRRSMDYLWFDTKSLDDMFVFLSYLYVKGILWPIPWCPIAEGIEWELTKFRANKCRMESSPEF